MNKLNNQKIADEANDFIEKIDYLIDHKKIEQAFQLIETVAHIYYHTALGYKFPSLDAKIDMALKVYKVNKEDINFDCPNDDYVLFVDYFGWDNKGLTIQYVNALLKSDKKLLYLHLNSSKEFLNTEIYSFLKKQNISILFVNKSLSLTKKLDLIFSMLRVYKLTHIFFHTAPWDILSVAIAAKYLDSKRYQINITDHAYWLGVDFFDYIINFRQVGVDISVLCRESSIVKQILIPMYASKPSAKLKELPVDVKGRFLIVSGGNTYKVSAENNPYFSVIKTVLNTIDNAIFLYIGGGDPSQINEFISKNNFQNKAFYLGERSDFFEIMQLADVYFATYPVGGGLMSLYAANAGIPFVSLCDNKEQEQKVYNVFFTKPQLNCVFVNEVDCVNEFKKLKQDKNYYYDRQKDFSRSGFNSNNFEILVKKLFEANPETVACLKSNTDICKNFYTTNHLRSDALFLEKYYLIPLKHLKLKLFWVSPRYFFRSLRFVLAHFWRKYIEN
ncbi:MAG: hypothetical protein AB7C96_11260 [Hydrogenovibrio sp.]